MVKRQSAQLNAGTVSSAVINFTNPLLANSALYCAVRTSAASVPLSVIDSLGQTFTLDAFQQQTADTHMISLWSFTDSAAGADSVTVTLSSAQILRIIILEYAGMALTNLFDLASSAQANGVTSINTGNISTTQNDELFLCLFGNDAGATMTADGAFTQQEVILAGANQGRFQVADRLVNSTGIYSATPSQNAAGNLSTILAAYKGFVVAPSGGFTGLGTRFLGHFPEY